MNKDLIYATATEDVCFAGPGLRMAARIYQPDAVTDHQTGIGFCHGFGGNKEGTPPGLANILAQHGYTVCTFDYRGFGGSEGPRGRMVQSEQIEDTVHALEYFVSQGRVDPDRVGIYGTSFGAGIALLAALTNHFTLRPPCGAQAYARFRLRTPSLGLQ